MLYEKREKLAHFCVVNSFCKTINSLSTSFTMQKLIENGMTHFCVYFSTFLQQTKMFMSLLIYRYLSRLFLLAFSLSSLCCNDSSTYIFQISQSTEIKFRMTFLRMIDFYIRDDVKYRFRLRESMSI